MSARDITLPDQAFAEMIAGFDGRIAAIEKAAMWNGAVRSVISTVGGTATPFSVTPVPPGYPDSGAVTVVSMMLDPGRWVLLSMLEVNLSVGSDHGGPTEGAVGGVLRAVSGATTRFKYTRMIQYGGGLPTVGQTLTQAMEISYDAPIEASLRFFYTLAGTIPDPFGTGRWERAVLLAFPG